MPKVSCRIEGALSPRGGPLATVVVAIAVIFLCAPAAAAAGHGSNTTTLTASNSPTPATPTLSLIATRTRTSVTRSSSPSGDLTSTLSLPSRTEPQTRSLSASQTQTVTAARPTPAPPLTTLPLTPAPTNATPPFEPDLSDLEGTGAILLLGIVLGIVVMLFFCVFCGCITLLKPRPPPRGQAQFSDAVELDVIVDPAGGYPPPPMPLPGHHQRYATPAAQVHSW
jgi:hypothetical protein